MKNERILSCLLRFSILAFAALSLVSCNSKRITLSDMLGAWTFRNTVVAEYSRYIDNEWLVRFNADKTYFIPELSNMAMPDFDCDGDLFRMILHYPLYGTHLVYRFLWEGEVSDDDELTGKIYFTSPPQTGDVRDAFSYPKDFEIGIFTARKLSE
jgi:hypothetical protein